MGTEETDGETRGEGMKGRMGERKNGLMNERMKG